MVADAGDMYEAPFQSAVSSVKKVPYARGSVELLAEYQLTARVLSTEHYSIGRFSEVGPVDLALGWGRMADPNVYKRLKITQANRFYNYRWENGPPIPKQEIVRSSANVHILPASKAVERQIKQIRKDQVVSLKGFLVYYREDYPNGSWKDWRSSLTREDSGGGACEVFYVEHAVVH